MASEIKVDTISEKTSGNGVTIDGVLLKDGGITGDIQLSGTTPSLTIGDAGAEDAKLVFDGNAQDFYIALDDSADDLLIGKGSAVGTTPAVAIDENLQVKIVATTASTSATTGSFIAAGGVGVAADLHVGDDVTLISDSAVLGFGADKDTTLTHTDGTGLTLNGTNKLCFNDATQFIQGASGTVLDIAATDEIELTATEVEMNVTTLDVNGNVDVSGTTLLPTLGVITAKDLGVGVHIRTADSGASVSANADELVIENGSAIGGISILSATDGVGAIAFGDSGDNDIGVIYYNHDHDRMEFHAGANHVFQLKSDQVIVNEDSDGVDFRVETNSLTHGIFSDGSTDQVAIGESAIEGRFNINGTSNDDTYIGLKSSDVAHGVTDTAETDTFFKIGKANSTLGGAEMTGFSEDIKAIELGAMVGAVHTTKSTSGELAINARARLKSGTAGVDMSSNANIFGVSNRNTTVMIVDTEGEIHSDGGAQSAYDTYDDAQLVRAYDLSHGRGVIDSKFDKFISYNHEKLAEMKLVGREEDGTPNHFVNVTGMQRLHNGAIWQQYEKHNQLLEAVYDLAKEAVGEEKANAILDKHEVKRLN